MKPFLHRITVTEVTLLTQTSHSGLKIQTVDLLYLQSTSLEEDPVDNDKERHPTSTKTFPTACLMLFFFESTTFSGREK
jgi:hypothetical protein